MPRSTFVKWSPFLVSFAITCIFFIDFCAWIFQCGCHSLWAGADAMCNIHSHHGRHCPWCQYGWQGQALVMIAICMPQLFLALKTPWNWQARTLAAVVAFPLAGVIAALAFGLANGYWTP